MSDPNGRFSPFGELTKKIARAMSPMPTFRIK